MKTISVAEARALDRDAVERLGMPSILLMENASRGVATLAAELGERFVILCGPGNNGGDGLAAARHLGPERCAIHLLAEPDPQRCPDAALQLSILRAAGWAVAPGGATPSAEPGAVWIDALFGTGLVRAIEGRAADWIAALNAADGPRLAVDVPSGLDGDRGVPLGPACVRADVTATFAAAKHGLVAPAAAPFVGRLVVVPLGIPTRA
ncbi:MAG: NAD(P)H-hydrate epimerase [Planctomycetes bacterium]|nr:NAD(P)H-hydrate epimerase [Planctomycetota bacterium]